ncbi:hypothetical protein PTTG_10636 [Puccinia triticina 1-1 BBBD Race 1]|uniref:NAM-associated domain-containing protein n=2 Tax=Puccinia triticina TaxID=208348 RepID=A0A180G404_PUCT1|nr:uncharacterized protein PtA15_4A20 [Puccinia triticina]OAV87328.1 hypothetical protein PTTG_10636 [Puccinia triticina 1-1 BBBD Race 1]WAQ83572.1 hypothetical protein PtA15_4A20 [Puccinia triticina]WAR54403.1 hypothetical protein PtB15_4B20 [Puccinia triticina]
MFFSCMWDLLRKSTAKFSAHYNKAKDHPPSGSAPANYVKIAKKAYYKETQKVFLYDAAWSILYPHEKWRDASSIRKKKTQPTPNTAESTPQTSNSTQLPHPLIEETSNLPNKESEPTEVCPIGIKSAKRKEAKLEIAHKKVKLLEKNSVEGSKRIAQFDRANQLQEETNHIQQERADGLHVQIEMTIMDKDLSKLDEYTQEYYLEKKNKIIQDMRRNKAANQARQDAANQAQSNSQANQQAYKEDNKDQYDEEEDEDTLPSPSSLFPVSDPTLNPSLDFL